MNRQEISTELSFSAAQKSKEADYWMEKLSGDWVKSSFPRDYKYKKVEGKEDAAKMDSLSFTLPPGVSARLMKISSGSDFRVHMILVAAVTALLSKYTGNRDILLGTPIYKQEGSRDMIDRLVNTVLVLRNRLPVDITFKELLLQVKNTIVEAEEHQNFPIDALLYKLNIPVSASHDFPLFDVAVLLENIHDKFYLENISINTYFLFLRTDETIKGRLEFNRAFYAPASAERIVAHFIHLLQQFMSDVDAKITRSDLVTEQEKARLLNDFNDTYTSYDRGKTINVLFEEQVERAPDYIGLMGEIPGGTAGGLVQGYLTYSELKEKSDQLARLLRQKGVGPDTIVGIMLERSIEMIAAIMAVLKAGGAYLPINLDTPKNRIVSILDDAGIAILLTQNRSLGKYIFTSLQGLRSFPVKPVFTGTRPPINPLDRVIPDRTLVDYGKYNQYIGQCMAKNAIVIQASRGCPYHCAYCHKIWPKKQVFRSPESIFNEVKQNYHLGMRKFAFVDDIFNLNIKSSTRFFELVIKEGLDVQFFFPNGLRGDLLNKDYIDLMVEAGTVSLALALETASPRLQKVLGKNLKLDKFRENIEYFCHKHPRVILELFTMHGFPGETKEEALMTLEFVKSLHWVHFPYVNVLKIYPNTDMEKIAMELGISREAILASEDFAHYELSDISPFDKNFSFKYRSEILNDYFLCKERLLHVLPHQMKVLSEDELLQKYNSYLPMDNDISGFNSLLSFLKISPEELERDTNDFAPEDLPRVYQANLEQLRKEHYREPDPDALRVLLLDLSQFFSSESEFFYDVSGEAPLGLMYLLTYLDEHLGTRINGKIAKSRVDFDSYVQLRTMLEEFKPDVIGVRSLNIYKNFFHKVISLIRQWGFNGPMIAGGPYATSDTTAVLQDRNIDLVVLSEGEVTFLEVIQTIIKNQCKLPGEETLKNIKGIAYIPGEKESEKRFQRQVIMMDELKDTPNREVLENFEPVNKPENLAYVIFTSGSTGRPKGVMIHHGNVHHLVRGLKEKVYQRYDDRRFLKVALVAPYFFDASVKQIFGALLQGHCLCIVPEETRADAEALLEFYRTHDIDISDGTPTLLRLLLESISVGEPGTMVKHFLIGGEVLPRKLLETLFSRLITGSAPVITNVYGPTECSVDATSYEITRDNVYRYDSVPIGKPMPNVRIFISSRDNHLQPPGVMGEILIGGFGVGRGYLNFPELTAGRFCLRRPDRRFYRSHMSYTSYVVYLTGDLARWLPDGNIEFLGRKDHQVKIRGYRIELGEIENCLLRNRVVEEAVVMLKKDKTGDNYLCAYIVPNNEGIGEENAPVSELLKQYLCQRLPEYMIPAYFVSVEKLPLSPNGKIDRKRLPEPEILTGGTYTAPANEIEKKLAEMWGEILGLDKENISMEANFFELGGHSLKATILIARIHRQFDIKIPLAKVFETPTIRGTGAIILKTEKEAFIDLEKVEKKEYYPLSYHQQRLWYIQQAEPETTAYTMVGIISLDHEVAPVIIKKVLDTLMARHESFRTYFAPVTGEPVQIVSPHVEAPLRTIDISTLEQSEKEREYDQLLEKEALTPCDMTRAPVFRCLLVKLDNQHSRFIFSMNHINTDGWSMEILRNEFYLLYEAYRVGKEVELEPLEWQYKDFCQWQHSQMTHTVTREKAHRFWKEKLETGVSPLVIPGDFKSSRKDRTGAYWQFMIDNQLSEKLKKLADTNQTTLFMVMFSTYILLLSRFANQEDIACSIIHSGRSHTAMHKMMGFFVNSILFKTRVDSEENFNDILQRVSKETLEIFQYQNYPLELLCDQLKMKYPELSVCFNMLHVVEHARGERLEPFEPYLVNDERNHTRFDIETYFCQFQNAIDVRWMFKKNLYKPETIKYMIDEYINILDYFAENPGKSYREYRQKNNQESIW